MNVPNAVPPLKVPSVTVARQTHLVPPASGRKNTFDMALVRDMASCSGLETKLPFDVRLCDRVDLNMRNTRMMAHPMHLHDHHFQVVAVDGWRFAGAMHDTVDIPPQHSVTIASDAANSGK